MARKTITDEQSSAVDYIIGYFTPELIRLAASPSATLRFAVDGLLSISGMTVAQLEHEDKRRMNRVVG